MTKIGKTSREKALGKMTIDGKKTIFTHGGLKVKTRAGDKSHNNKKGEWVIIRKNGNRVIFEDSGRITRVKRDGTRVTTLAPEEIRMGMIPAGKLKPIKGSKLNPPKPKK